MTRYGDNVYTKEEDEIIIALYVKMDGRDLAAQLKRPYESLRYHASYLRKKGYNIPKKSPCAREADSNANRGKPPSTATLDTASTDLPNPAPRKGRGIPWTRRDDDVLKELWGQVSDYVVGASLGRSPEGCRLRAWRLGISRRLCLFTAADVQRIFRVSYRTVRRWITARMLAARYGSFGAGPHRVWHITASGLERFILRYPHAYDRRHIDPELYPFWRKLADRAFADRERARRVASQLNLQEFLAEESRRGSEERIAA